MLCKIVIKAHTSLLLVLPPLKWIVSSPRPSWSGLSDQFVALPVIWGVCRVGTQGSVCPIHSFCLRTVPSSLTEFFFFLEILLPSLSMGFQGKLPSFMNIYYDPHGHR